MKIVSCLNANVMKQKGYETVGEDNEEGQMRKGDPNIPEVGRREGKDKAR